MSSVTPRMRSLDGLRGAAALAVVFHHLSLVARPALSSDTWAALTRTPLKLFFPGTESVLVFFVLSGLVVALPALRDGFSWRGYYPARILRLYLPVFGALLFSAALILLFPRDPSTMPAGSWMERAQATAVTPWSLFSEASLARRSYTIDNVLWSLRWELLFSLLLPLFVWLAIRAARYAFLLAGACVAASALGRVLGIDALVYFPLFLAGSLFATRLTELGDRSRPGSRWRLPLLGALGGILLIASWLSRSFEPPQMLQRTLWGLAGAGAALLVVAAVRWPAMRDVLEIRPVQWLGRISFSLYLTHVPIIATMAYLFGPDRWWAACLLSIPLSLAVAVLFQHWVEAPSHRLARAAGVRARERVAA